MRPRLVVICGLPGSGKTTLAKQLESSMPAVRFCPDDWMTALEIDLFDQSFRSRLEAQHWALAQRLLALGVHAVIEFGSWARAERDVLREHARAHGYAVELRYLDVPMDDLVRRVEARAWPHMTRSQLEEWATLIQVPDADELALFDPPPPA